MQDNNKKVRTKDFISTQINLLIFGNVPSIHQCIKYIFCKYCNYFNLQLKLLPHTESDIHTIFIIITHTGVQIQFTFRQYKT